MQATSDQNPSSFRFSIPVLSEDLDVGLCVSSGQVFRWTRAGEGTWIGAEGDRWYEVSTNPNGLDVRTNGTQDDFESLFRLDWSASEIRTELLRKGPELKPYIEGLPGLRVMRPSDPVETFFCFLCTPNNNVARITQLVRKLSEYGPPLYQHLHRFPTAERIAEIPEAELRAQAFGYRGGTIPRIAQELVRRGGSAYLSGLKKATYEEAHEELTSFNGIGPKLADCIALFALDHTESVPVDTHLWQAATRVYFPDWRSLPLTPVRYKTIGDFLRGRFGRLAGWAHQYLFYENLLNWRTRD